MMLADREGQPTCRQFRQKRMFLYGAQPDLQAYQPDSLAHCWCLRTQREFGPDDRMVDPDDCCPDRNCFEPL